MAPIQSRVFYKKPHTTVCIPSNNIDSEGSSSSDDECERVRNDTISKKKVRKGCIIAVPSLDKADVLCGDSSISSSASSEYRWGRRTNTDCDKVIPPSDDETSQSVPPIVSRENKKRRCSRKPSVTVVDRYASRTKKSCLQPQQKTSFTGHTVQRALFQSKEVHKKFRVVKPSERASRIVAAVRRPLLDSNQNETSKICVTPTSRNSTIEAARTVKSPSKENQGESISFNILPWYLFPFFHFSLS